MVLLEGIELSTSPLPMGCSTTELQQRPARTDLFFLALWSTARKVGRPEQRAETHRKWHCDTESPSKFRAVVQESFLPVRPGHRRMTPRSAARTSTPEPPGMLPLKYRSVPLVGIMFTRGT
jgi:hypothetical protein